MVLLLVAATAFFVAVEFSLVAVDRSEVELRAAEGDRRARLVAASLRRLSFHLSGVQLGITVCSVGLGVLAEPSIARLIEAPLSSLVGDARSRGVSVVVALFVATVVQMLVGELVPKAVAVARPLGTARFLAPFVRAYAAFFRPVIVVFGGAADRIVRRLGVEPTEELSQVRSRQELVKLVESSGAEGTLAVAEAELLARTFRFRDKSVAEVLTPRTAVVALPSDAVGADLIAKSIETGFSRFVLYGTDLDDIVGLVHVKSLFAVDDAVRDEVSLAQFSTEVLVVPESRRLDGLLVEMRESATYLAVVLDEYGGMAGIVTLEDLLEVIVGEIDDEHDRSSSASPVWHWGRASILSGRLNLDEVREATGLELPEGGYETLGGFVLDQMGSIPNLGDEFAFGHWQFEVLEMDRRRVATVRLSERDEAEDPDGATRYRDADPEAAS